MNIYAIQLDVDDESIVVLVAAGSKGAAIREALNSSSDSTVGPDPNSISVLAVRSVSDLGLMVSP